MLDRRRLLQTLDVYGGGAKIRGILEELWENKEVITRQRVYCGPQFQVTHGTTQWGMALPTLFNMAAGILVRH